MQSANRPVERTAPRRRRNIQLAVTPLEQRQLLAIDLAGISGSVAGLNPPGPFGVLEAGQQMIKDYKEFLPPLELDAWRRVLGEQEVIATYEPDKAIATLPALLPQRKDRERLLRLLERLADDPRVRREGLTPEQRTMLERVRSALAGPARVRDTAPVH